MPPNYRSTWPRTSRPRPLIHRKLYKVHAYAHNESYIFFDVCIVHIYYPDPLKILYDDRSAAVNMAERPQNFPCNTAWQLTCATDSDHFCMCYDIPRVSIWAYFNLKALQCKLLFVNKKGDFEGNLACPLTPSILLTRKICPWKVFAFQQDNYVVCNGCLIWDLASFWESLFSPRVSNA